MGHNPTMSQRLHLIDASPLLFRAWFSMPSSIVCPKGRPTGALHGFLGALVRLAREERPQALVVAFDESLNTSFRNEIYPGYKAGRDLPPPELETQCRLAIQVAEAFGALCLVHDRFEADDLIAGALAAWLEGPGDRTGTIVTIDKDLGQLIEPRVELFDFTKGVRWDAAALEEKFGVAPAVLPDYQGLAGDPVDSIPGVRGIGAKTAAFLIATFGDLEGVYADLEAVAASSIRGSKGIAEKLAAERDQAFLSRDLARLATDPVREDGCVPDDLHELSWKGADRKRLDSLCEQLGFRSVTSRVPYFEG